MLDYAGGGAVHLIGMAVWGGMGDLGDAFSWSAQRANEKKSVCMHRLAS